jgi:prepilin-type N-terminal cleavage/methylation domain-containing protein/prepilin-type processing-associated H-X9-DG protein
MSRRQARPRGFTLIELLVVITIVGVLMAILLPAVNVARESARRAVCQSNLKNISVGIQSFVTATQHYPNAGTFGEDPAVVSRGILTKSSIQNVFNGSFGTYTQADPTSGQTVDIGPLRSWVVDILPYIDRQDLFSSWNPSRVYLDDGKRTVNGIPDPSDRASNLVLGSTNIAILNCPSDIATSPQPGSLSYVVNGGFSRWHAQPGLGWSGADGKTPTTMPRQGTGPDWGFDNAVRTGVMYLGTNTGRAVWDAVTKPASLTDGSGQTLLLAESVLAGSSASSPYSDGVTTNWASPHPNFSMFIASDNVCQGSCFGGGLRATASGSVDGPDWFRANLKDSFEAINDYGDLVANNARGAFPYPNSRHPGGVNVAMCDGSVRFIAETISGTIWSKMITPAGGRLPSMIHQLPLGDDAIGSE